MSYKSNNSNNQHGNQYSNQYRPEYNNNNNNFNYINNNSSNNYGIKPYEMGEHAAINPRIQELSESDYVQSNQHQPYHGSLKRGSISNSSVSTATAIGTPQLRSVNNDDNVSVRSSIYSQPSTSDPLSRNNSKNHATNELANNGVYGDPRFLGNNMMIYPPSHQANSLVFNNNNNQQQQPLIDRTSNLDNQNNYDSYNSNNSNNNQQQDVYNDYNNYHYPSQNQSYYNDQEATRHNSMTLPDNNNMNSSYDFHNGSKIDSEKENLNQPMMIDNTSKKQRKRCCCCSGVHCVIITFVILILLAVALYFVWPRIPTVKILDAKPVGTPSISQNPPLIYLDFVMRTQIDNKENWIPFRFNRIDVQVFDSTTISSFNKPIATGNITDYTLQPKQISEVGFPLNVNYVANDASDPVLQDFLSACTKQPGTQQTTLNLRVDVKLFVWGIDWIFKPAISVPVNGIKCPYPQ